MASTDEPTQKPSQAEGERNKADTPQADLGEAQPTQKPSQAEGDREIIEADIRQKERQGKL